MYNIVFVLIVYKGIDYIKCIYGLYIGYIWLYSTVCMYILLYMCYIMYTIIYVCYIEY